MIKTKQHSVHQLIHTMDASEKAYFKKFGFKRDNKNNASYIAIFNLIDKKPTFDIGHVKKDKKINTSHQSNPHAALNKLFKILSNCLVEYRKEKNSYAKLFHMILEFDLYKEKGLMDIANKKYAQMEQFVEEKKMYYFRPYVYQIRGSQLRNDLHVQPGELETYFKKLDISKTDLDVNVDINKISLKLEQFFHKNGGIVNKGKCSDEEIKELLDYIDEAIKKSKDNFLFLSILNNNRFIVQMMFTRMENIEKYIQAYLTEFDLQIILENRDASLGDILITLKNYAVVSVYLGYQDIYKKIYKRMEAVYKQFQGEKYKEGLLFRMLNLEVTNFALNKDTQIDLASIDEVAEQASISYKNKAQNSEAIITCMMAYMHKKELDKALQISDDFVNESHNDRIRDQYISIRLLRAIVWFKKDQYEVFQSEITSIYRKLLNMENFPFQLHITQMLKKLSKLSLKEKNNVLIKKIIKECNHVLATETGAQMMKAIEIRGIALLALS